MRSITKRQLFSSCAITGVLGLAFISLAGCSVGDTSTGTVTTSGSAALQNALAFITNRDDKTISVVGLTASGGLAISTMGSANEFEANVPGDMQFSEGEWVFVNLGAAGKVATIDPLSGATPIHEANLQTGERPVHIYRDPTDGEVIWSMNDANATTGLDSINCATQGGGSVTVLHNSHIGQGGNPPTVLGTTCLLSAGHKVAAFSQPTVNNPNIPRLTFVSTARLNSVTSGGEIAVIDNVETSANYRKLVARIDLCDVAKEANPAVCDDESATPLIQAFTPNNSNPHGIRWSQATGKIYSIQENYREIVEIDPTLVAANVPGHNQAAITRRLNLAGTPYTSFGITPDGRFLFLRGADTTTDANHVIGKLAVVDLIAGALALTEVASLTDVVPSTFKFSPDGKRLYMILSNTATGSATQQSFQKKDRLFSFDPSGFPAPIAPLAEIILPAAAAHNFDVLVEGSGAATGLVVTNGTPAVAGSISIIYASTHAILPPFSVGKNPGGVMIYYPGAAFGGNQATSSLTTGSKVKPASLPERLDDHGMPE